MLIIVPPVPLGLFEYRGGGPEGEHAIKGWQPGDH